MPSEQALQVLDWCGMVLNVQIDEPIIGAHVASANADHEHRRRLPPASIATSGLTGDAF